MKHLKGFIKTIVATMLFALICMLMYQIAPEHRRPYQSANFYGLKQFDIENNYDSPEVNHEKFWGIPSL